MSAISDINLGERGNCDTIKPNNDYKEILKKCADMCEELNGSLNEEQKKILFNLTSEQGGLEHESNIVHFTEGFKSGLAIAAESLLKQR